MAATVTACGSSGSPTPEISNDQPLTSERRLARLAFERSEYDQAAILYEQALERAYGRDDLDAIAAVGYELSVARLRAGDPGAAAQQARLIRDELTRRGGESLPDLFLVEAVALYEAGEREQAEVLAEQTLARSRSGDDLVRARAHYLLGSIAADRADLGGLRRALSALHDGGHAELRADRLELEGRRALLQRQAQRALAVLLSTADLRRQLLDYRGMARALGLAAQAAETSGDYTNAADLYFRAGRSAKSRGDDVKAELWLTEASRLAELHGLADISKSTRLFLDERGGDAAP